MSESLSVLLISGALLSFFNPGAWDALYPGSDSRYRYRISLRCRPFGEYYPESR